MGKCEGKHGHELPCFGRFDCDTPGCYRNRRANCGMGDHTWKERHAKGVPVKIYMTDEDFNKRMSWYDLDINFDDNMHLINVDDEPYIYVCTDIFYLVATFCNFRYKPEWIEKHKKQAI